MEMSEWERMTTGDENAFLNIYKSQYRALLTYGFSLTANLELAKDCVQEMFLELWKKHAVVNKQVTDVRAYLFTWLRRKVTKELSRLNDEACKTQSLEYQVEHVWSYEELLIAFQKTEEEKEKLKKALSKLTKRQLEIIELKYYENLSYADIATKTCLTPRTVYNMVSEAIRVLREYMHVLTLFL